MSAPLGVIEIVHYENGHKYMAERLDPPVLRGNHYRYYRLWEDGVPAIGHQWAYDREHAARSIAEMCETSAYQTIERLKTRINLLENSLRLANQLIDQGHTDNAVVTEVLMFEIQQHAELWNTADSRLTHKWQTPKHDELVNAQAKKIRALLKATEKK